MDKKKLFLITGGVILLTIFVAFYYVFNKSDEVLDDFDSNVISTTLLASERVQDKIFVDVKGAVKKPGVYEMNSSDRVVDAIKMAGGLKSNASTNNINLSKVVSNEMVIYVFTKSEITTKAVSEVPCKCETITVNNCADNDASTDNKEGAETSTSDNRVNINKASKEELMKLKGLGESKADAIITYRTNNGDFKTIEDIKNVSGIGDALFDKIKDFITV